MTKQKLTNEQCAEYSQLFNTTSGLIKTVCGIANNAAWSACLDAIDHIRKHPRYRQQIEGNTTPAREFNRFFCMMRNYERALIYPAINQIRFFHVADMTLETRKSYGADLTDHDYYDFWAAFGFEAYNETKPFFTSLVNKIRLAYLNHGYQDADIMGWAVAAQCALDISHDIWEAAIDQCGDLAWKLNHLSTNDKAWRQTYAPFDLKQHADFWERCVDCLNPSANFLPTETEKKNINSGYIQYRDKLTDENVLFGSRIKTAEQFAEIFRTNGEMKKAMRKFAEARAAIAAEK